MRDSLEKEMSDKTFEYIGAYHMLEPEDCVLVGVSGGADSVCLLHLLAGLRERLGISLYGIHLHHGIRGREADRDAAYAAELCGKLLVPCTIVYEDAAAFAKTRGVSVEEAGRILRYQVFEKEAERVGAGRIAVAHHGDDDAETMLYHLFRGSGLRGVAGIKPIRGKIVRPILFARKEEILSYLEMAGLFYCEDSTNNTEDYTRNKIRNGLIPWVRSNVNTKAVENILQFKETISQADEYFVQTAGKILCDNKLSEEGGIGISAELLQREAEIIQDYLVMGMLRHMLPGVRDITFRHITQIRELAGKNVGKHLDLPNGMFAVKTYEGLWLKYRREEKGEEITPKINMKRFSYQKGMEIPKNQYTKWFDCDRIGDALSIRKRQPGDYIQLKDGGKKTVKSFFIDEKVPREQRDQIFMVAEKKHVLWITGYRISEYYKVTDQTKMVLEITLDDGS